MTSPADSNRKQRWWTANRNIPMRSGILALQRGEDVNNDCAYEAKLAL